MTNNYINIYNNLVELTRNKNLYKNFIKQDEFSDRLLFFLLHFGFFLKNFKEKVDKKLIQDIYDSVFRNLELSIREIGYGDQTINKKMKNYLNIFYDIIGNIDDWENFSISQKKDILAKYIDVNADFEFLSKYFDKYRSNLINNTLNSYIKGVVSH